ncbi:MAG: citrate synthase [Acidimicrobiia bacterium]|nr:citrate synthase [Acidimicrobiia bacterium]
MRSSPAATGSSTGASLLRALRSSTTLLPAGKVAGTGRRLHSVDSRVAQVKEVNLTDQVHIQAGDGSLDLDRIEATLGMDGVNVSKLRASLGVTAFDPGFANTAGTVSSITHIDGGAGSLHHRGYSIEDLTEHCSFLEIAYLLYFGDLPNSAQLAEWTESIRLHTLLSEEMKRFFDAFPRAAHPMAILSSATSAISTFYEEFHDPTDPEAVEQSARRLIAKMPTIAAWAYKKSIGQPYVYPRNDLGYVENFLHMMFGLPVEESKVDPVIARALNALLILHADHGQNCSTATVRFVGSSRANMFGSVAAGMNALWGPLHGGANQAVIEMLQAIHDDPDATIESTIANAKDKDHPFRLMGFGHRVYKNYDPRARILEQHAHDVLERQGLNDPLLDIARKLEAAAREDDYFVERNLYPNVDFYSGLIFRALGFPMRMFTVLFAIGRLPGWIANWKEMAEDPVSRISRPRQIYVGETPRDFVPLADR